MMRFCRYPASPSLSHKSPQVALLTRSPGQECATSCAMTASRDLSPAMIVGETNDSRGFSMPPTGKLGGSTKMSYRTQGYGPTMFSAALIMLSASANSLAAADIKEYSAYTPVRGPVSL